VQHYNLMTRFDVHTLDTAPIESQPLLRHSQELYGGMIPNLHGVMAEAPALLEAYQQLNKVFDKTSLSTVERNIVWLTINYENGCTYCIAAHSAVARHAGVSEDDIRALRGGAALADNKLEALRRFTAQMVRERGWAKPAEIEALLQAGYNKATALEVVLAIGMKTLSNYTNHIAATPLDRPFEKDAWSEPGD
jgi:AhpD family alkylhydroperoxidase